MSKLPLRLVGRALLQNRAAMARRHHGTAAAAVKPVPQPESEREKTERFLKECGGATERTRPRKPQRPPFAKNLFVGRFDADLLAYPELEKEDADALRASVAALPPECTQARRQGDVRSFVGTLAANGLVGLQAPRMVGGRGLNVTESCRMVEAVSGGGGAVCNAVANEWLGVQAVLRFGDERQKKRYLPGLLSGGTVAAFGLLEDRAAGAEASCTSARPEPGADGWVLNGDKIWVLNGNCADVFVVLAETGRLASRGMEQIQITAYMVDRKQEGVAVSKYPLDEDSTPVDMAYLKLTNVAVSNDNVLGEVNQARSLVQQLVPEFRLACGVPPLAVARSCLDELTRFCIASSNDELALYETDEVLTLSGELAMRLYAMESLVYLTTGLMDQYESQDCELEAAIVKTFNAEQARRCVESCVDFIGTSALLKEHWCRTALRESLKYVVLQESHENMRMMIALMGLQHAGVALKDTIAKLRNPLFNAGFVLRRVFTQRRHVQDDPRPALGLENHLHPTLRSAAALLEYSTARLHFAAELLLTRHGGEVVNRHVELGRLGDCAMDVLAMTACLGRASRSYCIGLRASEFEMMLAEAFCRQARERVRRNVADIFAGDAGTIDKSLRVVGKRSFKAKEYFAQHPLARNF